MAKKPPQPITLPATLSFQAVAVTATDADGNSATVGLYADEDGVVHIAPVVDGKVQIP